MTDSGEDLDSAGLLSAGLEAPSGFFPYGSTSKNGFPTSRVSPAATWNLLKTPATGLLISTVTLSVYMLATVSSSSTHCPYSRLFFNNVTFGELCDGSFVDGIGEEGEIDGFT